MCSFTLFEKKNYLKLYFSKQASKSKYRIQRQWLGSFLLLEQIPGIVSL